MKKTLLIISVILFYAIALSGQNKEFLKTKLSDSNLLPQEKVLSWIKTDYDFAQEKLTVAQIDTKIDSIIVLQKNKMVEEIQTPINLKKLKYYTYYDFKKLGIIGDNNHFTNNDSLFYKDVDGQRQIFKYDNIVVLNTFNAYEDQLNVYAIIRAVLILKNKYPDIYKFLFQETEKSPLLNNRLKKDIPNFSFVNINKHYVFSIHQNNKKVSNVTTTCYNLGYKQPLNSYWTCDNNAHLIFMNKTTLRNGGAYNLSNSIYSESDSKSSQIKFLFDGLIQTIVHERIHDYISNNMSVNKFLNYIRIDNSLITGTDDNKSTYTFMEEPIVTNTTNQLFLKHGGLSNEIMTYYTILFDNTQLPNCKKYTDFDMLKQQLKSLQYKNSENNVREIFKIEF